MMVEDEAFVDARGSLLGSEIVQGQTCDRPNERDERQVRGRSESDLRGKCRHASRSPESAIARACGKYVDCAVICQKSIE